MDRRWLFIALFLAFLFCNVSIIKAFDIQGAINSANPGDTINIPDGTYTESIDVPATLSGIIILGQSRDGTIVTNTSGSGFVISADNVSIKSLTVKGYTTGRGLDFLGGGTVTKGLVDNVIADGNGDGIAIDSVTASDFKIQNSKIINNNYSPSGIYISDSSNIQITNNQITGNSNGVDLVGTTSNITLSGNTFGSNSLYDIFNNTSINQTATGNTWGTFDGSVIKGRIYDKLDDATLGLVTFDNTNPTVNAGTDKIKKSSFTQDATASDTYGIASFLWSAPVGITFSNTAVEDPQISASVDGTYTITLTVTDTSGNTSNDTFQLTWDTIAPTGFWVSPVNNWTISGSERLEANSADSGSGVSTVIFQYKQNNGLDTFHNTPADWNTVGLALDGYTGRIVVTDKAGNSTNIDRNFYVAAVISNVVSNTLDTSRIQINWNTDRLTDGRIIYDTTPHSTIDQFNGTQYGYMFSSGTESIYSLVHSIVLTNLSDNTQYNWRIVSGGTPIVVSTEYNNRTMSKSGASFSQSTTTSVISAFTKPTVTPKPIVQYFPEEEVLGIETEGIPNISPTPTPEVIEKAVTVPKSKFNWWIVILPAGFTIFILGLNFWRK